MKKLFLSILFLAFNHSSNAQNKSIIVLGSKNKSTSKKRGKVESSTAFKINALNFVTGNLPICIEKEYNNFALLVGAGPTFRRFLDDNFLSSILDEDDVVYSWGDLPTSMVYSPFSIDFMPKYKYKPGYYFVINPKYYYNEEGMDGGYFGVQLVMSQYSFNTQGYNSKAYTKSGRDRYTDILVQWGSQFGDNKFVFEWFSGVGVRFKNELRYAYAEDFSGNTIEGTGQVIKSAVRVDLGIRVGFKL